MNLQETIQFIKGNVDVQAIMSEFPDLDFGGVELNDGRMIISMFPTGKDPDLDISQELTDIEALTMDDLPDGRVKNVIVLEKYKRKLKHKAERRQQKAILKQVRSLIVVSGLDVKLTLTAIRDYVTATETEVDV